MGANEVLKVIVYAAVAVTSILTAGTLLISLRYRKEIFQAEKRRARTILHPHLHKHHGEGRTSEEVDPALLVQI